MTGNPFIQQKELKQLINEEYQNHNNQVIVEGSIDDYEIIKELGSGQFGLVFLMQDKQNKQQLAVKQIDKGQITSLNKVYQLQQELHTQYQLNHPNITQLYSHFEDFQYFYLAMELCQGGNLKDILDKQKQLSEIQTLHYVTQTIEGLKYLHSKGIMHRDIKPENIFLDEFGNVKIGDFGSSRTTQNLRITLAGTVIYTSPENVAGKEYNHKIDIWSVGVLIYELLCGKDPFYLNDLNQSDNQKMEECKQRILDVKFQFPENFPPQAADLIRKVLQKDPNERPSFEEIQKHFWIKQYKDDLLKKQLQQEAEDALNKENSNNNNSEENQEADDSNIIKTIVYGNEDLKEVLTEFKAYQKQNEEISVELAVLIKENDFMRKIIEKKQNLEPKVNPQQLETIKITHANELKYYYHQKEQIIEMSQIHETLQVFLENNNESQYELKILNRAQKIEDIEKKLYGLNEIQQEEQKNVIDLENIKKCQSESVDKKIGSKLRYKEVLEHFRRNMKSIRDNKEDSQIIESLKKVQLEANKKKDQEKEQKSQAQINNNLPQKIKVLQRDILELTQARNEFQNKTIEIDNLLRIEKNLNQEREFFTKEIEYYQMKGKELDQPLSILEQSLHYQQYEFEIQEKRQFKDSDKKSITKSINQ